MRPLHKPGPKSKTRGASLQDNLLGETDTSSSSEITNFHSSPRQTATAKSQNDGRTSTVRKSRAQKKSLQPVPAPITSRQSRGSSRRKQRLPTRKELKLLLRTDFMIPRLSFSRVVREIMMQISSDVSCITALALEALQTAAEKYMENRFEDAYLLALHAKRVTLLLRDLELINYLMGKCNL
ncbi:histone H3-like centromeric protein A [Anastrepha ludens]|uniref:histone H3-like centromeric protein A n=1 Tax=Anastrepha ludens TaxID=28586 RepID=UPI0023B1C991|nr:histone H3-like centromeric protein A [Anastrepha ludens]